MAKIYYPLRYEDVEASSPHDGDPAYRVSFGIEHWPDGTANEVYKIQMVYAGIVAGRKSPSFPARSKDFERVVEVMHKIRKGGGASGRGMISSGGE